MQSTVLTQAYNQWSHRPADQRFETLSALSEAVHNRQQSSRQLTGYLGNLNFSDSPALTLTTPRDPEIIPTHHAFSQLCSTVGAPASYLRSLPVPLVKQCLGHALKSKAQDKVKLLAHDTDTYSDSGSCLTEARAFTSPTYGRIWDAEVVDAVDNLIAHTGNAFYNPKDWSGKPSGLYASDHDIFLFFIDGGSIVDGGSDRDQLNRGFFVWNSEVGTATFGISTFLFRYVCGNHMVWGTEQHQTLKIRHTAKAPHRFADQAAPALLDHMQSSVAPLEAKIAQAKHHFLTLPTKDTPDTLDRYIKPHAITRAIATKAIRYAEQEEGQCATLWDFAQGLTAYARDLAHTDSRIALETRVGAMLDRVLS